MNLFNRRGSITIDQMPDKSPTSLRKLSDQDLYRFIAGWKEGTADWIGGQVELRRRENEVARWALFVSIVAILVSVAALFR